MESKKPLKVIIAEDDFLVGREVRRTLESVGYEVVAEVSNGEAAVAETSTLRPDVVFMDIQMPKLDGLQAAARIQGLCPTPVVVLTAHESHDLVEKASDTGVGAYLTKPPKPAEIERAVTIAVARHADLMACRRLYQELEKRNRDLEKALAEIKTLRGILPICANCKKIRDDAGYWNQIEAYIRDHSEAEFSHGICPDCARELYPDLSLTDHKHPFS